MIQVNHTLKSNQVNECVLKMVRYQMIVVHIQVSLTHLDNKKKFCIIISISIFIGLVKIQKQILHNAFC